MPDDYGWFTGVFLLTMVNKTFSIVAGMYGSTNQMLVSPDTRPLCASFKTSCLANPAAADCASYYFCGDTELPRTVRLNFWSPATTKRICGEVIVTVNNEN